MLFDMENDLQRNANTLEYRDITQEEPAKPIYRQRNFATVAVELGLSSLAGCEMKSVLGSNPAIASVVARPAEGG